MRRILLAVLLLGSVLLTTPVATATGGNRHCDFDNDGYDDAAIGVAGETVGAEINAGAVNVIYGSQDKLISIGDQLWTQNSSGIGDVAEASDFFGIALECGDFNNDNYADLVIGAPFESIGTANNAGAIHLLFGSAAGLTAADSLLLHRDVPGVNGQAASGDTFGWSLAAGDFNRDGRDDLAVGAYGHEISGLPAAGSVQVFYGFAGGLSTSNDEIWHRDKPGIRGVAKSFANFGWSLTTGDFNNNGYDDLVIGVRGDTINGMASAGSVSVIYGSPGGLTQAGDDVFHRATRGVAGTPETGDSFGYALAAGDFDNDGFDELAVGVPLDNLGPKTNAGSVHVLEGGANGLRTGGDKIWHRDRAGVRGVAGAGDFFGRSLAAGRFNAGARYDLAIGAHEDTIGPVLNTGSVHVLYGASTGLTAAGDQIWHQGSKGINGANEDGDRFGFSVATGDFDGNGFYDLLIGVPHEDGAAAIDSGRVAVIFGGQDKFAGAGDQSWSQDSAGIRGAAEFADLMGRNVSGGGR